MDKLKKQLEIISKTKEINDKIVEIGNRHNLPIDLEGDLYAEVSNVICGFKQAKDFVDNLKERLEISDAEAKSIAGDVSKEIFATIRERLRKMQEQEEKEVTAAANQKVQVVQPPTVTNYTPSVPTAPTTETLKQAVPENIDATKIPINKTVSNIERVGGFKIEQTPTSSSPQYKEENINRDSLLKGIEDTPVPLVDHMLTTPVVSSKEIEIKNNPVPKQPEVKKPYSVDPYREQI